MMGQDLNSFKTLFTNNSNKLEEILTDKAYKNVFKQLNSDKDLELERLKEQAQKAQEQSKKSENQNTKQNTTNQNNNANANQVDETKQSNIKTEEQIRADFIKFKNGINDINDGYIRSNDNVQKMIELIFIISVLLLVYNNIEVKPCHTINIIGNQYPMNLYQ